ncbi:sulfite exporter TauE/SafE family protein [Desulfotruncus alcoholivorax]|uniref:sulfite exporter TauE/SafE family protein n=1 Tax=Desulfotruncus alcoholivorax TaxID=265477 RepID=UPI00041C64B7|nr:sulfite exporter TauE/SafE family protein [Desulfotruncus alcoholivorax]
MSGAIEIPATVEAIKFIAMTPKTAISLFGIGLVGGVLSGFLGSGGAFIMTPAMMSLGVPGIMAVAANITHKFGKAIMGSKKHSEFGNVDMRMGLVMFVALFAGVQVAVAMSRGVLAKMGEAGSNLYISVVFVIILTWVSWFMFRDIMKQKNGTTQNTGKTPLAERIRNLNLPPMVHFKVAGVKASLWLALLVGFATGFLAGTIGVGGFIGVPAMIYLLGIPTYVAAGTELFLAIFSGAQGAFLYSLHGLVDIRITLILYLGSLIGVNLGAIGTRIVRGSQMRMVMVAIIAMVALSRATMIPVYLSDMGRITLQAGTHALVTTVSNVFLFGSGAVGVGIIMFWMFQAYRRAGNAALAGPEATKAEASS